MIEEGVLDAAGRRPIAAYGLHVGPQDRGTFHYVPGPMMASSSNLTITVLGKGGHGSRPHDAIDPVAALTWEVPEGPAAIPYRVKQLPEPVYVPPPDRGPITGVVVIGAGLTLILGIAALTRRALRRG